jgi:hypothetical protein
MKLSLEKFGTVGTWFAAAAGAAPCCLPLLASVGGTLGLSTLAPYGEALAYALQGFILLAAFGHWAAYRRHRNRFLLVAGLASAAILLYAYNFAPTSAPLIYSGLLGLAGSAMWSILENRRCSTCQPAVRLSSLLTCPHCGFQREETMPTDACVYFYDCPGCGRLLRPRPGDCCVFCSYGTVKCPPMQAGGACCA